jgi:hypothetical protein
MSQLTLSLGEVDRPASLTAAPAVRRVQAVVRVALLLAGMAALGSYAIVAWAHARDRYQLTQQSGIYAALAMHLNHGTLYPDLYDGAHFGGTRYMPLQFVLHAGLARLTGEYLISGKMLTYGLVLILFAQLFSILRRLHCDLPATLALLGLVVLSDPGFHACTTIRGDLLAVVLQLGALQVAAGALGWRRAVLAALLCTLAVLTKLNAGWAGLAILGFYLFRQRRLALVFVLAWAASAVGSILLVDWLSDGRMLTNLRVLAAPGLFSTALFRIPVSFLRWVCHSGPLMGFLVPLLIVECVLAVRARRLTIYHLAFFCCLLATVPLFADKGVGPNHLIDLLFLSVALLGCLWGRLPDASAGGVGLRPAFALGLVWAMFLAWSGLLIEPVQAVARDIWETTPSPRSPAWSLGGIGKEPILTQDPWVSIARNQLPIVLDPFSVGRLDVSRPEVIEPLKERIRQGDFRWIVLLVPMDDYDPLMQFVWTLDFGPQVVQTMRDHYRFHSKREGYYLYVPKAAGPALPVEAAEKVAGNGPREENTDAQ